MVSVLTSGCFGGLEFRGLATEPQHFLVRGCSLLCIWFCSHRRKMMTQCKMTPAVGVPLTSSSTSPPPPTFLLSWLTSIHCLSLLNTYHFNAAKCWASHLTYRIFYLWHQICRQSWTHAHFAQLLEQEVMLFSILPFFFFFFFMFFGLALALGITGYFSPPVRADH